MIFLPQSDALVTRTPSVRPESTARVQSSLPVPLTPLVGRDPLLAEIRARLLQPGIRLLTLIGPGGVGKTRLAIQAAVDLAGDFDEIVFVDFTPVAESRLALPLLAQSIGVLEDGATPLSDRLSAFVGDRQLLFVLDNLERILPFGSELAFLLRTCPRVKMLITSRAPLRISGEQELLVPPLELEDAIELFVARARAVRPSVAVTPESESILSAVCRELDMLPLAIELAAARTKVLSLEAMLSRLEHRLTLLTGGPTDAPERQRTLRDAIAWSYDLLDEADQRRFRRMAVFSGGFTLTAFERVVADELDAPERLLDSLASLVDKNLVRVVEPSDPALGAERFGLLETVREYALEQLTISQELDTYRDRHATYYLDFIEQAAPEMARPDADKWMKRIGADVPNLRVALDWLAERQKPDDAQRLASAPWLYWLVCGQLREGRSWLDKALGLPGGNPVIRSRAVGVTGYLASNQGDFVYGSQVERDGLTAARQLDDRIGEAIALLALGDMACEQNDYARANDLMEAAIELCDAIGDRARATIAMYDLGSLCRRLGHEARAEALLGEVVRRGRDDGFGLAQAFGLNLMSRIERARGHIEQARAMYLESLALARQLGHRLTVAFILLDGATLAAQQREPERAARLLGAAEALRETIGLTRKPSVATATGVSYEPTLANVRAALGDQRFERAWQAGRSMTLDQVIEEAMWDEATAPTSAAGAASTTFGLTARELDVLHLLVEGRSDRQIGDALFISPRTVQVHVANILGKLSVPNRGAAAATALRFGLTSDSPRSEA